jgi:hypothetical protein
MGFHIRTKSAITKTCPAGMPNAPLGGERPLSVWSLGDGMTTRTGGYNRGRLHADRLSVLDGA